MFTTCLHSWFCGRPHIGMKIEQQLAIGTLIIRIILPQDGESLGQRLRAADYGVTVINGIGSGGEVKLPFTVIQQKNLDTVLEIIQLVNQKTFFSAEELRSVESGIFPRAVKQMSRI
jgi:uncharacterized protein YebE (UPF0316 family)